MIRTDFHDLPLAQDVDQGASGLAYMSSSLMHFFGQNYWLESGASSDVQWCPMGMFVVMSLTLKAVFFTIVDLTNVIQEQETWVRISSANGGESPPTSSWGSANGGFTFEYFGKMIFPLWLQPVSAISPLWGISWDLSPGFENAVLAEYVWLDAKQVPRCTRVGCWFDRRKRR